jgi:ribulose-phosphate 3-epimerase
MIKLLPSLLCANLVNLKEDIRILDKAKTDIYHIDVMDGHFVPNLGFSLGDIKQMKEITKTPFDVHLMVEQPETYIQKLVDLKVEYINFHLEAVKYPLRLIKDIRNKGAKAGIAISPLTEIDGISYLLEELDYLVVMCIEPGFSGQKFIHDMINKVEKIKKMTTDKNLDLSIEVDGDINENNVHLCIEKGANMLVCGATSIFRPHTDLEYEYSQFKKLILRD